MLLGEFAQTTIIGVADAPVNVTGVADASVTDVADAPVNVTDVALLVLRMPLLMLNIGVADAPVNVEYWCCGCQPLSKAKTRR